MHKRQGPAQGEWYKNRETNKIYRVRTVLVCGESGKIKQTVVLDGSNPEDVIRVEKEEFHFKSIHEGKLDWDWVQIEKTGRSGTGWVEIEQEDNKSENGW